MCTTACQLKGPDGRPSPHPVNHFGRFLVERQVHTSIPLHAEGVHQTVQTLGVGLSHLPPWTSGALLCFPVLSLLQQPASFSFPQSGKRMLPNEATGKEERETQFPSRLLSRNATNLAFRLFASLIRMPLGNLCWVSVHSFSLMKHQISFTNNSCVTSKHAGPSGAAISGTCSAPFRSVPSRRAHHPGPQVKVSTLSGSSNLERQKQSVVFKETVSCPQHLTQYLGTRFFVNTLLNVQVPPGCNSGPRSAVVDPAGGDL